MNKFILTLFLLELFHFGFPQDALGSRACDSRLIAVLDLAKESFANIRDMYQECKGNETLSSDEVINCFRDTKKRTEAYVDVAIDLIRLAKRKYQDYSTSSNLTSSFPKRTFKIYPADCTDVLGHGKNESGVHTIQPKHPKFKYISMKVFCDMETNGGGWTVIQRRDNYTVKENFFRSWNSYKAGFGNISKDFWLGNDNIYILSNQATYSIRFDMEDVNGERRYAMYKFFRMDDEDNMYKLFIHGYSGNAGDSLTGKNGWPFSAVYKKNDIRNGTDCAVLSKSGWWFSNCSRSNPNGVYDPGKSDNSFKYIFWRSWKEFECLKFFEIKIKKIDL